MSSWGHDEWAALGAVLSGVAALAAAVAAGVYFLKKQTRGFGIPNLSVLVSSRRTASGDKDRDWLAIDLALKKPDRGSISLHGIRARVMSRSGSEEVTFWGSYLVHDFSGPTSRADWDRQSDPLNVTPGEDVMLSAIVTAPTGEPCKIDVLVLGVQYGEAIIGEWHASTVSLPLTLH